MDTPKVIIETFAAVTRGLGSTVWARKGPIVNEVDPNTGLIEDTFVIESIVSAIESVKGVVRIS